MGNGSSIDASKIIYVEINGKDEKVRIKRIVMYTTHTCLSLIDIHYKTQT